MKEPIGTDEPARRRVAVLIFSCALQISCQHLPASPAGEAAGEAPWILEAALVGGSDAPPEELWLFLRSRSTSSVSMVCADALALRIRGLTKGKPIGRDAQCTDFANFTPIPPGGTLTVRLPSTQVREDSNFDGLSLVIVEGSWKGSGREYREVHWMGTLEEMTKAGQRLLKGSNQ